MKNKDILKQLNSLKSIKPSQDWMVSNRSVLLSQINGGSSDSTSIYSFWKKFQLTFVNIPQPAIAVFLIVGVLFGSGILGVRASRNTKPGDSLYIAKLINEKTKLVLTFSEEKKARLGLKFAQNRAVELKGFLEELEEAGQEKSKEQAVELVKDYKKEIEVARERITKLQKDKEQVVVAVINEVTSKTEEELDQIDEDEDILMFTAGTEKDEKGLQVSLPNIQGEDSEDENSEEGSDETVTETATDEASSTEVLVAENNLVKNAENLASQTEDILNNTEDINADDLSALTEKADEITAQLDLGEVKGATSSDELIDNISQEEVDTASTTE